jgi:hypothetical protein
MLPKSCKKAQLLFLAFRHPASVLKKKVPRLVRRMTVVTELLAGSGAPRMRAWRVEWFAEPASKRATHAAPQVVRKKS